MNFQTPLSALFPGTSGRLLTALVGHHIAQAGRPLTLEEVSKNAAVTSTQLEVDLRATVIDMVRREAQRRLRPAPNHLALTGAVIEGTATHPADVLELIVVPPPAAQADWHDSVAALISRLSRALGNVVVHCTAQDTDEAEARGKTDAVRVFLP